ncbi:helix-turn-helix domain-containing protein [Vibrio mytili]|uniref:helix-turn-helix domain-containing protein n=1 Tax=Vibrio mytili TaxID=50718 RepID=UPI0006970F82|nr:helix-turn-helix domain-containing protein [Vibrio mytili]
MNDLIPNQKAADYLGVTKGTLDNWRSSGRYQIPYIKMGRYIKYRKSDLDAFINSRTMVQTSTEPANIYEKRGLLSV